MHSSIPEIAFIRTFLQNFIAKTKTQFKIKNIFFLFFRAFDTFLFECVDTTILNKTEKKYNTIQKLITVVFSTHTKKNHKITNKIYP